MIREGQQYKFEYPPEFTTLPEYDVVRGAVVSAVRKLTPEEADGPAQDCEQMWLVRAGNGKDYHAFESELVS
jgi:hypothetical protein